jgi:hypothetical protein
MTHTDLYEYMIYGELLWTEKKFRRQLYQTSYAKAFGDVACRRCVHVTLNAKTTLVQSIESVQLYVQLLTFIMVKSLHCCVSVVLRETGGFVYPSLSYCCVSVVLRETGGFVYPSLSLNGRCKICLCCRDCSWFLIWL